MILLTPNQSAGFEPLLKEGILDGFEAFSDLRACVAQRIVTSKTTGSNLLHDAMIESLKMRLQGSRFRFVAARQTSGGPPRQVLVVDGAYALQFKLASKSRKGSNVATMAQVKLLCTGCFPVGWAGPLPMQTVLYELDEARTEVARIGVRSHGPDAPPFFFIYESAPSSDILFREESNHTENPANNETGSPHKRRKRIRRPGEEDEGDEGDAAAPALR